MQVYLVGGAVRDTLLDKPVKDKDFVVVGASVEDMKQAGFIQVGADFPVFLHPKTHQEYALARTERKSGQGYQGFTVYASPEVTLEDDLKRRDLTINAMAIQVNGLFDDTPKIGDVIDPYQGLQDIKDKKLRHVSEAFSEDPLRVLRVARFYGRYHTDGFSIAEPTLTLIKNLVSANELSYLSDERIWQESERATMQDEPHIYWQTLLEIGALSFIFPIIHDAWQNNNCYQQILTSLKLAGNYRLSLKQRWAIIIGSLINPNTNIIQPFYQDYLKNPKTLGKMTKVPKAYQQFADLFVQNFALLNCIEQLNATQWVELIQNTKADKNQETLQELLATIKIWQLAKQQQIINQAMIEFNSIKICDIDKNLKGAEIGQALKKSKTLKLQQWLDKKDTKLV